MGSEHYRTATRFTLEPLWVCQRPSMVAALRAHRVRPILFQTKLSLGTSYAPLRSHQAFPKRALLVLVTQFSLIFAESRPKGSESSEIRNQGVRKLEIHMFCLILGSSYYASTNKNKINQEMQKMWATLPAEAICLYTLHWTLRSRGAGSQGQI